jgi:hypothetical protein
MSGKCQHLGDDGVCRGTYKGFGCIGERCVLMKETAKPSQRGCAHLHESTYCSRYHKFYCPGIEACEAAGSAAVAPEQGRA